MSEEENIIQNASTEKKTVNTRGEGRAQSSGFKDSIARALKKLTMKENSNIAETERPPVLFIDDKDTAPIMHGVAEKLGLKFDILAKEGEEYSIDNGVDGRYSGPVPQNKAFMSVSGHGDDGLSEFWKQVDIEKKALSTKK